MHDPPVSRAGDPIISRREKDFSGGFLRSTMRRMSRFPLRMVCHAILRIDLVPAQVRELESTIRRRCQSSDAQLVDFCVDLGTPKRRPEDYPALDYFRAGKADALLIVCVPSDEPLPRGDLLTSRALSGFPAGWLAVPRLREVGLLPPVELSCYVGDVVMIAKIRIGIGGGMLGLALAPQSTLQNRPVMDS